MFTPLVNFGAAPEQACAEVTDFDKFLLKLVRLCADFTGDQTGGCVGIRFAELPGLGGNVSPNPQLDIAAESARIYLCAKFGPSWVDLEAM